MKQVWNIFKKDFRHHWPAVAASVAVLTAFAWMEVRSWNQDDTMATGLPGMFASRFLSGLGVALVPISWMFVIVRVVQGESLVGDRQFWVTRPYDWKKLLLAKTLFILVFVNLPLFVLDVFLLAKAGFRPMSYLPGLLFLQWMWILLLFLTTVGLATVTATIAQMLLAILIVAIYLIGMVALSSVIPNSSFSSGDSIAGFVLVATALAVILLQYSRRTTALSRWLILGLGAALTLQMVATPYRRLIAREYPLSGAGESPLTWSLLPGHAPAPDDFFSVGGDQIPILLPFSLSSLPKDTLLEVNGSILTLTNPQGAQWDSGWQFSSMMLFPGQKTANIEVNIKKSVFDRMNSSPVKARLLIAFTVFHDKNQRAFVTPRGEFALPDLGQCSLKTGYWPRLTCKVPLRNPNFLLITSDMATNTCPLGAGSTPPAPGERAHDAIQNSDSSPAEMGISPIKTVVVYLSERDPSARGTNTGICAGTPLVLSNPEAASRGRIELQFDNLSLADYQRDSGLGRLFFKR